MNGGRGPAPRGRGAGWRDPDHPKVRRGNLKEPPPTSTPGTGPGKFVRGKKIGGSGSGGSWGRSWVARGLRAAVTRPGPRPPPPWRGPACGLWHPRGAPAAASAGGSGVRGWRGVRAGRGNWGVAGDKRWVGIGVGDNGRPGTGSAGLAPRPCVCARGGGGGAAPLLLAGRGSQAGLGPGVGARRPRERASDTIISFSFKLACCRRRRSSRAAGRRLDRRAPGRGGGCASPRMP